MSLSVADAAGRAAPAVLLGAVVTFGWALASRGRSDVLPSPLAVAQETARLLEAGELLRVTARTLATMALAFAVSAGMGIGIGLTLGTRSLPDRAVSPYLVGLQSLPSIVWIPIAVLFLGASQSAVLAVTILGALPSIAIGTRDAVHSVPPLLLRAARSLGARGASLLARVVVPAALPGVVSALEHGWAFAFRSLISAELIAGARSAGIGGFVNDARRAGDAKALFAAVVVILIVGVVVDRIGFARWQRRLRAVRGLGAA